MPTECDRPECQELQRRMEDMEEEYREMSNAGILGIEHRKKYMRELSKLFALVTERMDEFVAEKAELDAFKRFCRDVERATLFRDQETDTLQFMAKLKSVEETITIKEGAIMDALMAIYQCQPLKKCNRCKEVKLLKEFSAMRSNAVDGRNCYCLECERKRVKEWSELNRGRRKVPPKAEKFKKCKKCRQSKPTYKFSRRVSEKDGLLRYCKQCEKTRLERYLQRKGEKTNPS